MAGVLCVDVDLLQSLWMVFKVPETRDSRDTCAKVGRTMLDRGTLTERNATMWGLGAVCRQGFWKSRWTRVGSEGTIPFANARFSSSLSHFGTSWTIRLGRHGLHDAS